MIVLLALSLGSSLAWLGAISGLETGDQLWSGELRQGDQEFEKSVELRKGGVLSNEPAEIMWEENERNARAIMHTRR